MFGDKVVLKRYAIILALLLLPNVATLADAENETLTLVCQVMSTDVTGSAKWIVTLQVNYAQRTVLVWGGSSAEYPAKIDAAQIGWTPYFMLASEKCFVIPLAVIISCARRMCCCRIM